MTVLICDDDKEIAEAISIYLKNEGYQTLLAHNGKQAIAALNDNEVHLLILDIMMPEMDGIRATAEIRRERNIPIIMLSAKNEEADKIIGLNMGADDYMTKPFNPLELIARVRSQVRRYTALGGLPDMRGGCAPGGAENARAGRGGAGKADGGGNEGEGVFTVGGLSLDEYRKTAAVDGAEVRLTPLEYKILQLLIKNPGRVFSIDEIYERAWGEDSIGAGGTVSVHIRRIREKIEINPGEPKYLKVVWGLGYKIEQFHNAPRG